MSGFEVAGVVLGSLPLLISALEHYSDGVSTIKSMQRYETVFDYLHASLVTNLTIYRNSLEELLSPLALSDAQLYKLLEQTDGRAWDDPKLASDLRHRLGSSYLPFKSSIKQIYKKLNLFAHKLQLDKSFKPSWVSDDGAVNIQIRNAFFRNPLTRLRGGFNSEKYKQLLSSLQNDIDRLSTLTAGAIALEPLRVDRKQKSNATYWTRSQKYAEKLYESLNSRWSSQCTTCQCSHEANLRLPQRRDELNHATTFNLLLSLNANSAVPRVPWSWRAVEIEPSEVNCLKLNPSNNSPSIVVHSTTATDQSWDHCIRAAPKITDLCEALKANPTMPYCMGVLHDTVVKHHIHSKTMPGIRMKAQKRATLRDIVDTQPGANFNIKEKCSLALTLANAVLQLHDTPWLGETWSMSDILILSQEKNMVPADQPYISRRFAPDVVMAQRCGKSVRIVKNATIFALGVALLEISYGGSLKSFEISDDLDEQGNRTILTDYLIADRLLENIHGRELPNYANATRRCIHCNFEGNVYSLKNDDFRERFYQGVILPLQQDYDYATTNVAI